MDEGDGEDVEKGIACMLQVVCVASVSPFWMVDVCLGCVLHSCQGEEIGKAANEEEPNAGQEKPRFAVEDHLSH